MIGPAGTFQAPRAHQQPEHAFYDQGWNARVRGEPYDRLATGDWQCGWKDCDDAPKKDRKLFPGSEDA